MPGCSLAASVVVQMRVVHLNRASAGGAARFAITLHEGLQAKGIDSVFIHQGGDNTNNKSIRLDRPAIADQWRAKVLRRVERLMVRRVARQFYSVSIAEGYDEAVISKAADADIVHIHWVSHWLSVPRLLDLLPRRTGIVVTVHDMGLVAGGCHLYNGCRQYESDCANCPILHEPLSRIVPRWELRRRRLAFAPRRPQIVANSRWTLETVKNSAAFGSGAEVSITYPGVDGKDFYPTVGAATREELGLPREAQVIGFGCADLGDQNKNFDAFRALVKRLGEKTRVCGLVFGGGIPAGSVIDDGRIRVVGALRSPGELRRIYGAMDVFIVSSYVETFGQVAVEAQLCEVPVSAFAAGALSETVADAQTGLLAPVADVAALERNTEALLADEGLRRQYGRAARERAMKLFSIISRQ